MKTRTGARALAVVAAFAAAVGPLVAQAQVVPPPVRRPIPQPVPRPIPQDPASDRLAYQRSQLLNASERLAGSSNAFYTLARQQAYRQQVVYDRYYGRRVVLVADPAQRSALAAAGGLVNASVEFRKFQLNFNHCGAYERNNGLCDRTLAREVALLRNLRYAHQTLKQQARQLRAFNLAQARAYLDQVQNVVRELVGIYQQAGVIERPRPPGQRPVPRQPIPAPQPGRPDPRLPGHRPAPGPVPAPQPAPAPAPAPGPADPSQAQRVAQDIAAKARVVQQEAQRFRSSQTDEVAVESIDALVLAADNVVELLRANNAAEAKFAAQQLQVQFNASETAVEIAMQRTSNLNNVEQRLNDIEPLVQQLVQTLGGAEAGNGTPTDGTSPGSPEGGYGPGDRPPYEEHP